ncbi:vanin-like protein 1 [Ooceraea biroi]|uniref:Vanin-like protein n=1 Tax=Ooceraea biroi TaxID=2015173 RepID=A0A026WPJ5_OOCBI|nr:vanin-like protein 1 [Ooceraea biroi]XP_011334245.1 vanin-like protein 1 [Ooceraea biroi]XP_011334248.1 vanin-like protein 1 [Ooceraea biroi]XP_019886673.1 vanin-like protein 1 [Ooceraea biroi]EZA57014.1 Vanin-like protein [Ooceraea biroi]
MDQRWIVIYVLIACTHLSYQLSTPDSSSYIAAVVEYPPIYVKDNAEATLRANTDAYIKHINAAGIKNTDIIVFPEDGLTTVHLPKREKMQDWATIIPDASDNYTPCTQSTIEVSETLKRISCAAKENRIYVVINIAEKLPCTDAGCAEDKMFYYNSNVVFDRTGKIIARYRKTNLFVEPQFNVTSIPEIVIFKTDFGVNFGTFICFDILFHEPALQLTRLRQITDIVYPTAWFSEAPFLTAVQTQAGWSFGEDVNLLASGYNRPGSGNTGSGIYLGRKGIGKAVFASTTHEELLIFEVPKIKEKTKWNRHHDHSEDHDESLSSHKKEHDELRKKREDNGNNDKVLLLHDNIHAFETVPLEGSVMKNICQNGFCCEFNVNVTTVDPNTKYRLAVFSGNRRYVVVEAGVQACGVIQCSNDSIASCGSVEESETMFGNIDITATFHDYKNVLIMPSTLTPDFLPLSNWKYDEHVHDDHVHISMSLNNNTNNLVTFGIYARNFSKSSSSRVSFDIINYFIALISLLLLRF